MAEILHFNNGVEVVKMPAARFAMILAQTCGGKVRNSLFVLIRSRLTVSFPYNSLKRALAYTRVLRKMGFETNIVGKNGGNACVVTVNLYGIRLTEDSIDDD